MYLVVSGRQTGGSQVLRVVDLGDAGVMVVIMVLVMSVVGDGGGRTVREAHVVFGGFNVGLQEFENLVGVVDSREDLVDHVHGPSGPKSAK
jgi:hypothetical protein